MSSRQVTKRTFDTYLSAYANILHLSIVKIQTTRKVVKKERKIKRWFCPIRAICCHESKVEIMGQLKQWRDQQWVRIGTDGKLKDLVVPVKTRKSR